jgi:hypothetical protein
MMICNVLDKLKMILIYVWSHTIFIPVRRNRDMMVVNEPVVAHIIDKDTYNIQNCIMLVVVG